jgi:hypothetical protein
MERSRSWSDRTTYSARFEDGPRGATVAYVLALDSGQPPDLLLTPGRLDWVYALAGGQREDGTLPYLWMPNERVAALQRLGRRRPADRVTNTS